MPGTKVTVQNNTVQTVPSWDSQSSGRKTELVILLESTVKGKYKVSEEMCSGRLIWSEPQKQLGTACGTRAETEGCSAVGEVQGLEARRTGRAFQVREHYTHSTFHWHSCRPVCVGTLSAPGPSVKWKTSTGLWVLITVIRRVSFMAG